MTFTWFNQPSTDQTMTLTWFNQPQQTKIHFDMAQPGFNRQTHYCDMFNQPSTDQKLTLALFNQASTDQN